MGLNELVRVYDAEIVEEGPLVHGEPLMSTFEIEAEFTEGNSQVLAGGLRMARACEHARVKGTLQSTLREFGFEKSQGYTLAKTWRVFGEAVLSGEFQFQTLSITHLGVATRADEPVKALEMAEDERLTVSQLDARIRHSTQSERVQKVEAKECPSCGADSKFWQRVPGGV